MDVAQQIVSVLFVFALLGLVLWTLRRKGFAFPRLLTGRTTSRGRAFEAVDRLALTPQHALHMVRIDNVDIIVATHPGGCSLLMEKPRLSGEAGAQ